MNRIVGLDLGTRTLGVAISDPLRLSAQGIKTIKFNENNYKLACELLKEELASHNVELFVLGNPLHMNGDVSDSSKRSMKFKKRLEEYFGIKVILWDERLSSVIANKMMSEMNFSNKQKKNRVDEIAAINILQGYLDSL